MSAGIIIILILALLLVIFTLQNTALITLKIFFWEITDVPLVLALILIFIAGIIVALIFQYPRSRRLKKRIRELKKEIEGLETDSSHIDSEGVEMGKNEKDGFFND